MAANNGKIVILSSLNGQFIQKPFPNIAMLIPLCEKVKKLSSICKLCNHNANFTFRTAAVDSADQDSLIGGAEAYIPLCRECLNFKNKEKEMRMKENENKVLYSVSQSTMQGSECIGTPLIDMDLNSNLKLSKNTVSAKEN